MKRIAALLLAGSWSAIAARAVSILASFVLTVVVVRLLGLTASGTFFIVFTLLAVLATVARLGTDNLALKLCGAGRPTLGWEIGRLWRICGIAGVLVSAIGWLGYLAARPVVHLSVGVAIIAVTAIVPQALSVLAGAILRGRGYLAVGTLAELGSIPALTILTLLAMRILGPVSIDSAVIALSVASWATALWSVMFAQFGALRPAHRVNIVRGRFWGQYRGALFAMMGTSLLFYILTWAPLFALTLVSGPKDVSYFTVAARLAAFITLIPSIQVSYLAPEFARLLHRGRLKNLNDLCNRSAIQATVVTLLPTIVLIGGGGGILKLLYGAEFERAWLPLVLLVVANFATVAFGQVNQLMLLGGLERVALVLNIALLTIWASAGMAAAAAGVDGVSFVTLASTILYSLFAAFTLSRRQILSFVRVTARRGTLTG